jgi:Ca-activated chloride channel family protein
MKAIWILVLAALPFMLFGQKADRKLHDFGIVEQWNNPIATFVVTNNTKADFVFLPTFPAKDVLVQLPQGAIKPGASAEVTIQYFTEKKGSFSRMVSLYTSNTGNTLDFTLKGDIRSFASGALTACPTIGPKSDEDKMYSQEFQVIDSLTREPIYEALVKLESADLNTIQGRTGKNGVVTTRVFIGYYEVAVTAIGYEPYYVRGNLAPHQGRIVFEMVRVYDGEPIVAFVPEPIISPNPTPNPNPTPTIEPAPVKEEPWIIEPDEIVEEEPAKLPEPTPTPTPRPKPEPVQMPPTTATITNDNDFALNKYKPNNIVFVLDISYSMRGPSKLPKLKESMKELVAMLRDVDYVTIISFSRDAQVYIPNTRASEKQYIYDMIDSLTPYSYTNGTKGIMMGYNLALQNYIPNGNNQMIVSTDGEFNNPQFDASVLLDDIKKHTDRGIILSVVGFGDIPEGKKLMRKMAHSGNGNYIHFGEGDMRKALVEEIQAQSLVTP